MTIKQMKNMYIYIIITIYIYISFFYYPRPFSNFTCPESTIIDKLPFLALVQLSTVVLSCYCYVLFSCVLFYCFFVFVLVV